MDPIRLGVGYLSPEPMLQDPDYVRGMAQLGYSTPTYAYASNNPITHTDPTGLLDPGVSGLPAGVTPAGTGLYRPMAGQPDPPWVNALQTPKPKRMTINLIDPTTWCQAPCW